MNKNELIADLTWGLNEEGFAFSLLTEATRSAAEATNNLAEALERAEAARRVHEWKGDWIL